MLKFKHTEVWGFEHALRGMRNPMNSWDKSDSSWEFVEDPAIINPNDQIKFVIGEKDLKLAQELIKAGSEHRKFMRQIFVSVDITAPMYWWKEFDTYKVGTVTNSTSTMHKLATTPITEKCFETDDYEQPLQYDYMLTDLYSGNQVPIRGAEVQAEVVGFLDSLEGLRQKYLQTKDNRYWKELIRWLPMGWLYTRTVTMNYENLLNMCSKGQRRFHKLNEWSGINNPDVPNFISWARSLPYAQELIFIDEVVGS